MSGRSTVSAPGLPALRQSLAALPDAARTEVATALVAVATDAATEAMRGFGDAAPSAPGGPPADPTGGLAASISVTQEGDASRIAVAVPYAVDLEYGTRTMAPRPFLRSAVAATAETARDRLRAAFLRVAGRPR